MIPIERGLCVFINKAFQKHLSLASDCVDTFGFFVFILHAT